MRRIDVTHPADLMVGDIIKFRLTPTSETTIQGEIENIGTRGAVKVKDYGWVDFSDAEWNTQECEFISATRWRRPEWEPGTLGRARVVLSGRAVRVRGVIDRNGDFRWAGLSGEGTIPMGEFHDFEPIKFGDLENLNKQNEVLTTKLGESIDKVSDLRNACAHEKRRGDAWKHKYKTEMEMIVSVTSRLNEPTHVKIIRQGQLIVDGFVSGDLRKAVVHG